jgi:protein-S-isoprenylcysteine O-methyltransferase Ste14
VRHPIYSGALLALLGSTLASGMVSAVLGWLLAVLALAYKLRIEERWMLAQFGEGYRDYQRASWALVPFIY